MKTLKRFIGRLAIPRSIRWRLPMSYALIALLATCALGGVLLVTLRDYYNERDRLYLENAAALASNRLEQMYKSGLPQSAIDASVKIYSFVAQARVRLLDANHQVVADSGTPSGDDTVTLRFANVPGEDATAGSSESQGRRDQHLIPFISVDGDLIASSTPPPGSVFMEIAPLPLRLRDPAYLFWSEGNSPDRSTLSDIRSDQQVTRPVLDEQGNILGYAEFSEGPAFGSAIVFDVAGRLLSAGAAAVVLAAAIGWVVSRNISEPLLALTAATRRMASGDLSTRVKPERRDEMGILAHSFNTMAERIEKTVTTLQRFVADAAHELNTPITALRTNLELAASEPENTAYRADVERALGELFRLETLTSNLLALARLEAPGVAGHHEPVDLVDVVHQLHRLYASRADQAGITLEVNMDKPPITVSGNAGRMVRMLDNLLDNAMKFTPEGGTVSVELRRSDEQATLRVRDTGIGIPEEDLPGLFGRFHRGRNAAAYPGNGLGLVIIKAIVQEYRGEVTVESSGSGTCFTIHLPLAPEPIPGDPNRKKETNDELQPHPADRG